MTAPGNEASARTCDPPVHSLAPTHHRIESIQREVFFKLVSRGTPQLDAFSRVMADPQIGKPRYRGKSRPGDAQLRLLLRRFLVRTAPEAIAATRDRLLNEIALHGDQALAHVRAVAGDRDVATAPGAALMLKAAIWQLEALGLGAKTRGVTVANQVNVQAQLSLGRAIMAARQRAR